MLCFKSRRDAPHLGHAACGYFLTPTLAPFILSGTHYIPLRTSRQAPSLPLPVRSYEKVLIG